jgi:methyl-accepting chemotaxis protein
MTIIKPLDNSPFLSPTKSPASREAPGADFARILAEQQAPAPKAATGNAASALLENQALRGLILPGLENMALRQQLERTIDQMDRYAAALGDETRSLKDIAPLADDLGQAADRLTRLSGKLRESDPLKGLSGETAVLATVEAMKFKRGDYV